MSNTPWSSFSQQDYSPQQWARSCLIDTEQGPSDSKDRYKLPVREPSGELNRNAVESAASRVGLVDGVPPEKRAAAARVLIGLYKTEFKMDPPPNLLTMSARSLPVTPESRELMSVSVPVIVEVRSGKDSRTIGGYAATFNNPSQNLGGYIERVMPSFFNKSRADGWSGVVCRYNHNDLYLLGATRNNTLQCSIDETGLAYQVDLPESRNDVLEWVQRGDIGHSSFSFLCYDQEWDLSEQGYPMRSLVSGKLIDVAPVPVPAYRDTTVAMRSLAAAKQAPLEDVVGLARNDELKKLFIRTDRNGKTESTSKPLFGPAEKMRQRGKRCADCGAPMPADGEHSCNN